MDLLRYFIRAVTIPLYDIKHGRNSSALRRDLENSQYLSASDIEELQMSRLRSIIKYANSHCQFYRSRFAEAGLNPNNVQSFDDVAKIPVLTKADIRSNMNQIISDKYEIKDLVYKRTGGSTSVPLKLYVDHEAHRAKYAATLRHNSWAAYKPGDKLAAIWGATDRKYTFRERLYNSLYARTIYLDTLKMKYDYNMAFVGRVRKFKPEILLGHAHSIYVFACFVQQNGIRDLGFKTIITTAEMLYDHERAQIESVFGKILFDRYGCEELSIIASECERHDGLHINAEGLWVEVLGGDAQTPGKLVITDLLNLGMPFIRYEIGDMATIKTGSCSCGRNLPRLGRVFGRTSDFLHTPDGRMISGISILDTFVIHIPGVVQVQLVQNRINELNVKIVKNTEFDNGSLQILDRNIEDIFGPQMKYEVTYVDKIPQTERGKYRFSICNISQSDL